MIDKPTQPTHWDWVRETRAIRDGRTEPPAEDSLSFELAGQLAGELGAHRGDDPLNDRAEEAQEWCERIMLSEGRERLLAQYNSSGELWLLNRLRGVIDDCLAWQPSDKPLLCLTDRAVRGSDPSKGQYLKTWLDRREPVYNLGGYVAGVLAAMPALPAVFSEEFTPLDHHGWLRWDKRALPIEAGAATGRGLHTICDWQISNRCESRRRFVLAFPNGNWLVYFVTCSPCANELRNLI